MEKYNRHWKWFRDDHFIDLFASREQFKSCSFLDLGQLTRLCVSWCLIIGNNRAIIGIYKCVAMVTLLLDPKLVPRQIENVWWAAWAVTTPTFILLKQKHCLLFALMIFRTEWQAGTAEYPWKKRWTCTWWLQIVEMLATDKSIFPYCERYNNTWNSQWNSTISHLSPCRPPLFGLTSTSRGCVPGRGVICKCKGKTDTANPHYNTMSTKHLDWHMMADLKRLTISSELKALVGVIRACAGGWLTFSPFYYWVTILDTRKGRIT